MKQSIIDKINELRNECESDKTIESVDVNIVFCSGSISEYSLLKPKPKGK